MERMKYGEQQTDYESGHRHGKLAQWRFTQEGEKDICPILVGSGRGGGESSSDPESWGWLGGSG